MAWYSLSEILAEFKISKDWNDIEGIKQELRKRLGQFHPDKTGGEYAAEEQEQQFMHIQDAIDFVNKHPVSTTLIPITQLPDIINELRKLTSIKPPKDEVDLRNEYRQATKRRYALPKITSGILAIVVGFLFSLQGTFKNHPAYEILRKQIAEPYYVEDVTELSASLIGKVRASTSNLESLLKDRNDSLYKEFKEKSKRVLDKIESHADILFSEQVHFPFIYNSREMSTIERLERTKFFIKESKSSIDSLKNIKSIIPVKNDKNKNSENIIGDIISNLDDITHEFDIYEKNIESIKSSYYEYADKRIAFVTCSISLLAAIAYVLVLVRERSDDNFGDYLLTDEGLRAAFSQICSKYVRAGKDEFQFSFVDFSTTIGKKGGFLTRMFLGNVNPTRLEQIANALIEKLINRKTIKLIDKPDVCHWYEIDRDVALQYAKR